MRTGRQLNIYIPANLADRLDAAAERNRRTKTAEVIIALEKHLGGGGEGSEAEAEGKPKRRGK